MTWVLPSSRQLQMLRLIEAHGGSTAGIALPKIANIMGLTVSSVYTKVQNTVEDGWLEPIPRSEHHHYYGLTAKARSLLELSEDDMAETAADILKRQLCAFCKRISFEADPEIEACEHSMNFTPAMLYLTACQDEIRRRICHLSGKSAEQRVEDLAAPWFYKSQMLDLAADDAPAKFWKRYKALGGRRRS